MKTDKELMIAYKNGDESAFQEIYDRHSKTVRAFIKAHLIRELRDDVDDITQQVFLSFHKRRANIKIKRSLLGYLLMITHGKIVDHIRFSIACGRSKKSVRVYTLPFVFQEEEYRESLAKFNKWLATKPEKWKTMLEQGTAEEVSQRTGIPATSVRHFTREGLKKLKELCT